MRLPELTKKLEEAGYSHYIFRPPGEVATHFFVKGEYRVTVKWRTITVEHCVSLGAIKAENGLIGPFRDGTYFDPGTGEIKR